MPERNELMSLHNRTVRLHINNESDLYNKFSLGICDDEGEGSVNPEINPELIDYLQKKAFDMPRIYGIKIELRVKGKSSQELAEIRELIKTEIRKKIFRTNVALFRMRRQSVILVLGAFVPLTVQHFFSQFIQRYALTEFFLVVAWVFMWKAVELFFFDHKDTAKERTALRRILKADFVD